MKRPLPVAIAVVLAAVALWPAFIALRTSQAGAGALPTPAPVTADYVRRDRLIAFWEGAATHGVANDMLSPRTLASQYLQRYRETGDIDDVLRAERMARRSLHVQPQGNIAARSVLASALLTLHRFREARDVVRAAERFRTRDAGLRAREASLDMELGEYGNAAALLAAAPDRARVDPEWQTVQSRYLEMTGHLADARRLLTGARLALDSNAEAPAQARAWYHFREGELAFSAGDLDAALAAEQTALEIFPRYADALRARARFECAAKRWQACREDAARSAEIVPLPETLGYRADAERALADVRAAASSERLIEAIERIGNAQHVSDRLLAVYYSEHRMRGDDALRIARRELAVRDDIYAEDTLAWAAAMAGRWTVARTAITKAIRFDTEDARLQYHAGAIALHFNDTSEAKRRFERALALNPNFHATYADDARTRLAHL